ncbi:MAG: hypothetical protein Q9187_004664 [Circinaria calcarea]
MATRAANKRLTREYKTIQENPPPYIVAHPSETNILEWHYILTGPPKTPYENGQYWGTLIFPPEYPFAPPAIRMHTPSGRFQPSTRLCLSISDFHPKSFNPAWEVSTILIGLMSFMTSDEMTTGSVHASEAERKWAAARTRWWNSTGGGTSSKAVPGVNASTKGIGAIKAGDGGVKFRAEWPELDAENWKWMKENRVDPATGNMAPDPNAILSITCSPEAAALRRRPGGSAAGLGAVVEGGHAARNAGQSWVRRHKFTVGAMLVIGYVLLARLLGDNTAA